MLNKPVRAIEKNAMAFLIPFKKLVGSILGVFKNNKMLLQKKYNNLENYNKQLEYTLEERLNEILQLNKELISKNEELYTVEQALNIQWESIEDLYTQLRLAQDKLVQTEKMASLGLLVAGIAHEINNPLNFINTGVIGLKDNFTEILELLNSYRELNKENFQEKMGQIQEAEKKMDYEEVVCLSHRLLNNIDMGVSRMVNIVNGLRTFARSDEKDLSVFNIHHYIDSTLLILHNKYKNRIKIEKNYGDIPEIEGYSGKISQVFMNILSNAIDAIERNGTITITSLLDTQEDKIKISIKDSGMGIPESDLKKIFEPFYSTKITGEGMGLGLSITFSIIKEHKGDIDVKSSINEGTEFILTLPIKQ
jgi:signal transduction histidine kinase